MNSRSESQSTEYMPSESASTPRPSTVSNHAYDVVATTRSAVVTENAQLTSMLKRDRRISRPYVPAT